MPNSSPKEPPESKDYIMSRTLKNITLCGDNGPS